MKNELLVKLINKINFDYANHFELAVARELSFVPINMQGDAFFVAVSAASDKAKISEYIKTVFDSRIEFIFLSEANFEILFNDFLKVFNSKYGNVNLSSHSELSAENTNEIDIDALPDANNHAVEPEVIPFDNNSGMGTVDIDSLEDIDISMSGSSEIGRAHV